jgi:hypothetical protein
MSDGDDHRIGIHAVDYVAASQAIDHLVASLFAHKSVHGATSHHQTNASSPVVAAIPVLTDECNRFFGNASLLTANLSVL